MLNTRILPCLCLLIAYGCGSITIDAPKGATLVAGIPNTLLSVPIQIEVTKSVYGRSFVVTGGPSPMTLSAFTTLPKQGSPNTEILSMNLPLQMGSYTLTAAGTYNNWLGQPTALSESSLFTVILQNVSPPTGSTGGSGTPPPPPPPPGPCAGGAPEQTYNFCFRKSGFSAVQAGVKACSSSQALALLSGQYGDWSATPGACPP